eukprot:15481392-Alexandrium_andersonii.AAC.1
MSPLRVPRSRRAGRRSPEGLRRVVGGYAESRWRDEGGAAGSQQWPQRVLRASWRVSSDLGS